MTCPDCDGKMRCVDSRPRIKRAPDPGSFDKPVKDRRYKCDCGKTVVTREFILLEI